MTNDVAGRIRRFIIDTFLFGDASGMLPDDASLLGQGVIDSTGVLDLVLFMEEEFGFRVDDEEVIPDNFDSVNNLTAYAQSKMAAVTA